MTFKELKPGNEIFVLDKNEVDVKKGTVSLVSPPHVSNQPGVLGMFVDITISADKYSGQYVVSENGVTAYASNNTILITTNLDNVLAELRGIKTNAESIVNSIDKYKDDVCRCDTLLAELDPEFKREQSYEQRFSKIEKALDKLADSNDKITDLLTQLTQKNIQL